MSIEISPFQALAALWVKLPGGYQELADATRDFEPGSSYMAYLQHLPSRAASSSSLLRSVPSVSRPFRHPPPEMLLTCNCPFAQKWHGSIHSIPSKMFPYRSDRSVDEGVVSCDGSSVTSLRRNALNPDDEGALPDTKRHKKTSTGRPTWQSFNPSSPSAGRLYESQELSEASQSHCVQRTVQPSKCVHCERLSIVYTVQCIDCQQAWHKGCFPKTGLRCSGQPARTTSIDRRMSIFGVSLKG